MRRTVEDKSQQIRTELSHGEDRWSFPVFANGPSCGTNLIFHGRWGDGGGEHIVSKSRSKQIAEPTKVNEKGGSRRRQTSALVRLPAIRVPFFQKTKFPS
jgi:hypothetical protein